MDNIERAVRREFPEVDKALSEPPKLPVGKSSYMESYEQHIFYVHKDGAPLEPDTPHDDLRKAWLKFEYSQDQIMLYNPILNELSLYDGIEYIKSGLSPITRWGRQKLREINKET